MKECPKCGFIIENDNAKFCRKCGTKQPERQISIQQPEAQYIGETADGIILGESPQIGDETNNSQENNYAPKANKKTNFLFIVIMIIIALAVFALGFFYEIIYKFVS